MRRLVLGILVLYVIGTVLGFLWPQLGSYFFWPLLLGTCTYLFLMWKSLWQPNWWALSILIILCAWFHTSQSWYYPRIVQPFLSRQAVIYEGVVADFPQMSHGRQQFNLDLKGLKKADHRWEGKATVRVTLDWDEASGPLVSYGDHLIIKAPLRLPRRSGNPGEFCYLSYLTRRGIGATSFVAQEEQLTRQVSTGNRLVYLAFQVREKMVAMWQNLLPDQQAALLTSMATGGRQGLPQNLIQDFTRSGLGHLLAVSGIHVGLVGFFILSCCQLFRLPPSVSRGLSFVGICLYVLSIGPRPSAWRALIMATGGILAKVLHRQVDLLSLWAWAALIILISNPLQLGEVGFQLSFAATWALIAFVPFLEKLVPKYLAACLAVQLGLLPLMAYHFQQVAFAGILVNPLAIPTAGIILALGLLVFFVALISLPLAGMLAYPLTWSLSGLMFLANKFGNLPLYWQPAAPSLVFLLTYYLLLIYCREREKKILPHGLGAKGIRFGQMMALMFCLSLYIWAGALKNMNKDLIITFIDVGQGDAILLEFPRGKKILIDGGGRPYSNVGETILLPFLNHQGIHHLDVVVCTHPHEDHYLGLINVLQERSVDLVMDNAQAVHTPSYWEYRRAVSSKEYVQGMVGLQMMVGDTPIHIIHPPRIPMSGTTSDVNNNSIVAHFTFGRLSFLMTGDLDREGQQYLLKQDVPLRAEILKFPHHGSRLAFVPHFLAAVNPEIVVVCVGPNPFGQPAPVVTTTFEQAGIPLYRTDEHGAITIRTNGVDYEVQAYLQKWWRRNWYFGRESN